MKDVQDFLKNFQKEMNWDIKGNNYQESRSSMLNNYMLLTTEVGEVAEEFRSIFNNTTKLAEDNNISEEEAFKLAKNINKEKIGKELSDCIAYIIKFANYLEIDLDESFYNKMYEVKMRRNKDAG
ncbi:MazG nucleotide pyrophosphohydrolase domain-containing protein [Virgibacillus ndiopensis]|uniref:MazG nucleotide pyrophosphohydrolase domain-containing protein n=1 Tax=Virgibacillus ndiopensis TaxID=2004408 RepID=UPI000C083726|nr:MazG nucleotide pyrophosphohydrolase domain-containing protein [Virgibacillus ndiopensis]